MACLKGKSGSVYHQSFRGFWCWCSLQPVHWEVNMNRPFFQMFHNINRLSPKQKNKKYAINFIRSQFSLLKNHHFPKKFPKKFPKEFPKEFPKKSRVSPKFHPPTRQCKNSAGRGWSGGRKPPKSPDEAYATIWSRHNIFKSVCVYITIYI